jgi:transcriptional regulator with XRE-family HTH domain
LFLFRHLRHLTQAELASLADVSRDTISHLENGEQVPRTDTAHRLAAALGVPLDILFPTDADERRAT